MPLKLQKKGLREPKENKTSVPCGPAVETGGWQWLWACVSHAQSVGCWQAIKQCCAMTELLSTPQRSTGKGFRGICPFQLGVASLSSKNSIRIYYRKSVTFMIITTALCAASRCPLNCNRRSACLRCSVRDERVRVMKRTAPRARFMQDRRHGVELFFALVLHSSAGSLPCSVAGSAVSHFRTAVSRQF